LATIDETKASSGSEALGVAATGRFATRPELTRAQVTRLRRLNRLPLGPAAVDRVGLQYYTIFRVSTGVRDPVD
jgi:hypothetical protein